MDQAVRSTPFARQTLSPQAFGRAGSSAVLPVRTVHPGTRLFAFVALAALVLIMPGLSGLAKFSLAGPIQPSAERTRATPRTDLVLTDAEHVPDLLARAGLDSAEVHAAAALIDAAVPLDQIAPGTPFAFRRDRRGLVAIGLRPRLDLALAIERGGHGLALRRIPFAVTETPCHLRGAVGEGIYRSARAAGSPPDSAEAFIQTIDQFVSIDSIADGDRFDLVIIRRRAADGASESGDLLYAEVSRAGRPLVRLLRQDDGRYLSLDPPDEAAGFTPLAPVAGRVSSLFGLRRHPILGFTRLHAGVDFAANWGSPVRAVADGHVVFAGPHGGLGLYVRIDHGGGIGTGYGHMSRIAVQPGASVAAGAVIGTVGSTGLSTGPHLHYELLRGGRLVDPFSFRFMAPRLAMAPARLAALRARARRLLALPVAAPKPSVN